MNILVVEDEVNLADALAHILEEQRYNVEVAHDGVSALSLAEGASFDAIVLDVMLPGIDGFEVSRRLRAKGVSTPILMLTARSTVKDKVAGLDAGGDDYMTKPFNPEELLARVRALTRRTGEVVIDTLSFGDLSLNLIDTNLTCEDRSVHLSWREGEVMKLLMRSPQTVLSKSALLTRVWGSDGEAGPNSVEAYISFLRKKLSFLNSRVTIDTIRMLGYRLSDHPAEDGATPRR